MNLKRRWALLLVLLATASPTISGLVGSGIAFGLSKADIEDEVTVLSEHLYSAYSSYNSGDKTLFEDLKSLSNDRGWYIDYLSVTEFESQLGFPLEGHTSKIMYVSGKPLGKAIYRVSKVRDQVYSVVAAPVPSYIAAEFWLVSTVFPLVTVLVTAMDALVFIWNRKKNARLAGSAARLARASGSNTKGFDLSDEEGLLAACIDDGTDRITDLKREITLANNRGNAILNSMPDSLVLLDGRGKILLSNKSFNKYFSAAVLSDSSIVDAFQSCLRDQRKIRFDYERMGRTYLVSVIPCHLPPDDDGASICFSDMTEQRRLEAAKSDFFAFASHELKSPLTSIIGYQQLIRSGILNDKASIDNALDISLKQAQEMKEMIRDMLDISSLESRKQRTQSLMDMAEVCRQCIDQIRPEAEKKHLKILTDLEKYRILINPQDAERMVRNILSNAVKYNKVNGTILVVLKAADNTLEISDTGIGIPKEDQIKVFDRFYRVQGNTIEGTGLGLSIVKHVCVYYGFKLSLTSDLGKGTTIKIKMNRDKDRN